MTTLNNENVFLAERDTVSKPSNILKNIYDVEIDP